MLTTIAKRIQSRLSRSGVKVTLGDIKEQCDRMISDINNPTENELLAVQEYFMSNATTLAVIPNDVDIVNSVDNTINTASIQNIDDISDDGENSAISPLVSSNKSELVASTANSLGVVLNTSEIELIASNFNSSSEDLTDSLEEIKSAIVAFIRYKVSLNSQKISETLEEISQVAADGFSQNSEALTDGLKTINHQLQQQSQDFKSKVKVTLSVFQLPAAS